jgi:TP901 family phage tail tape measure protein
LNIEDILISVGIDVNSSLLEKDMKEVANIVKQAIIKNKEAFGIDIDLNTKGGKEALKREVDYVIKLIKDKNSFVKNALKDETKAYANAEKEKTRIAKEEAKKRANTWRGVLENGTTFGHKFLTTAQYMAAGTAIVGVQQAMSALVKESMAYDDAIYNNMAVLNANRQVAEELAITNRELAISYGGAIEEIDELTLTLGRAGVATEDLAQASKASVELSKITGDSFGDASKVMSTFIIAYKDAGVSVEDLSSKLAYMANASKMSVEDLGTLSNYALSTASSLNLSADAVGALATTFSNLGMNASTIGTQIRKLDVLFKSSKGNVKDFWDIAGQSQEEFLKKVKNGDEGIIEFTNLLANMSEKQFTDATRNMEILEKQLLQNIRNGGDKIIEHFSKIKTNLDASTQAQIKSLGATTLMERAWNSITVAADGAISSILNFAGREEIEELSSRYSQLQGELVKLKEGTDEYAEKQKELSSVYTELKSQLNDVDKGFDSLANSAENLVSVLGVGAAGGGLIFALTQLVNPLAWIAGLSAASIGSIVSALNDLDKVQEKIAQRDKDRALAKNDKQNILVRLQDEEQSLEDQKDKLLDVVKLWDSVNVPAKGYIVLSDKIRVIQEKININLEKQNKLTAKPVEDAQKEYDNLKEKNKLELDSYNHQLRISELTDKILGNDNTALENYNQKIESLNRVFELTTATYDTQDKLKAERQLEIDLISAYIDYQKEVELNNKKAIADAEKQKREKEKIAHLERELSSIASEINNKDRDKVTVALENINKLSQELAIEKDITEQLELQKKIMGEVKSYESGKKEWEDKQEADYQSLVKLDEEEAEKELKELEDKLKDFEDFEIKLNIDNSSLSKTEKALMSVGDSFKDIAKNQELYNKLSAEDKAEKKDEYIQNQVAGYANLAGAMSGVFKEGSSGAKAFQAIQATLGIVNAYTAITTAWASAPYPANMPAVLAATTSVVPIIGQLSSLGGSGGSGGGGIGSVAQTGVDTAKLAESEQNLVVDRLDRQIELLETIAQDGTVAKYQAELAPKTFAADVAGLWAEMMSSGNLSISTFGHRADSLTGEPLKDIQFTLDWLSNSPLRQKDWNWLSLSMADINQWQSDLEQAVTDFATNIADVRDAVDDASQSFKEIFDELSGNDFYKNRDLSNAFDELKTNLSIDSKDGLLSYLSNTVREMESLGDDYAQTVKNVLLTGTIEEQIKALNTLSQKFGDVFGNSTEDALNFLDAIELVAEAMTKSRENIASFIDSFRTDIDRLAIQSRELDVPIAKTTDELKRLFDILSQGQDGLNDTELEFLNLNKAFIDALNDQSEAIENNTQLLQDQVNMYNTSSKNIESFIRSLMTQEQLTNRLANQMGVNVANNVDELSSLFVQLSDDADGLNDSELELINTNKDYIVSLQGIDEQVKEFNDDINSLERVLGSLGNVIDELSGSVYGSEYYLTEFYKAMDETLALAQSGDTQAFADRLDDTIGYSAALMNADNFTSQRDMTYAQAVALNQFKSLEDITYDEIDYMRDQVSLLEDIEENTRNTYQALLVQIEDIANSIISSNMSTSEAIQQQIEANTQASTSDTIDTNWQPSTGDTNPFTEEWINNGTGLDVWKSSGGAIGTADSSIDDAIRSPEDIDVLTTTGLETTAAEIQEYVNYVIASAGGINTASVSAIRNRALTEGISSSSLEGIMGWASGDVRHAVEDWLGSWDTYAFANGGIVTKPTMGLIGEAGYNEAVIPLKNPNDPLSMNGVMGELKALRSEVSRLRESNDYYLRDIKDNTRESRIA